MERRTGMPVIVDVGRQDSALRESVDRFLVRLRALEKPLTSVDIERFVDDIVVSLKKASAGRAGKEIKYVLDLFDDTLSPYAAHDISPENLLQFQRNPAELSKRRHEHGFDASLEGDYQALFHRLKTSVKESLCERLARDSELAQFVPSALIVGDGAVTDSETGKIFPHIVTAHNLNDAPPHILRDAHQREKNFSEDEALDFAEGRERFLAMAEHPNIIRPQAAGEGRVLVEKKENFRTLSDIVFAGEHEVRQLFGFFRDALEGGLAFENNGLVLEDVSLDNIGVMKDKETGLNGVLHDTEYVVPEGALSDVRMEKKSTSFPDFFDDHPVSSSDMTYQFACSLEELFKKSQAEKNIEPAIAKKFRALIEKGKGLYGPTRGSKSKHPVPRLSEFVEGFDELLEMLDEQGAEHPVRWAA